MMVGRKLHLMRHPAASKVHCSSLTGAEREEGEGTTAHGIGLKDQDYFLQPFILLYITINNTTVGINNIFTFLLLCC